MSLGYVVLTLHWFNPLIWVAYILFCRDIEVSCDERVLADLDREGAIGYAGALLSLASGRRHILAYPVAFGEYGVKTRVKNILSYKKPAVWAGLVMIAVCLLCAGCFLTDPKKQSRDEDMKAVIETFYGLSNESITDLEVKDFSDVLDQDSLFGKNYLTYLKEIVIQTEYALEKGYINSRQSSHPLTVSVTEVVNEGSRAIVKVIVSGDENEGYPLFACLGENEFILKYENERYLIESMQADDIFIKMLNEKQFNEVDVKSIYKRVNQEYSPETATLSTDAFQQHSGEEGETVHVLSDTTTELVGLNRCELPAEGTIYVYEEPFIRGTEKEIDKLGQGDTAYVTAVRRISWQDQNGLDYEELALSVAFVRDGKTVTGWVMDNLLPEPVFELKDGAKYYYYEENDRKLTEHIYQRAADEQGSHSPWEVIAFSDEEGMWRLTGTGGSEIYVEDLSVLEETERLGPALNPSPLPAG